MKSLNCMVVGLLLLTSSLNAQYFVKHDGKWGVYYGDYVKYQTGGEGGGFSGTIQQTWVFDDWTTLPDASFTSTDMGTYFGTIDLGANYNTAPKIVSQTLNGASTYVLEITNEAGYPTGGGVYSGLQVNWDLTTGYDELYMTYNLMLATDGVPVPDLKLPGFEPSPSADTDYPVSGDGFRCQGYAKHIFEYNSYYYDRTDGTCPPCDCAEPGQNCWVPDDANTPDLDSVYLIPGVWYNITQRIKVNTYTTANGIHETWIDGIMANQVTSRRFIEDNGADVDAINIRVYTGGSGTANQPDHDWEVYIDNLCVWTTTSANDATWGTFSTHSTSAELEVPYPITDREFYYDGSIITTESTLTNTEYGGTYSASVVEQYTIDAGAGNQVQIDFNTSSIASNDGLILFDGNTSDVDILARYTGQSPTGTVTSNGRYMHVVFITWNESSGSTGFSFDITHL